MSREELLSIIEKNSKIGLNELAVLLGEEEKDVLFRYWRSGSPGRRNDEE